MDYIIFQIEGGIGKNIVATSVIRAINKKYTEHKIIIVTAHPDIWLCNPRVHKVLIFGQTSYFYNEYISNKNSILFLQEPYKQEDNIYKRKHLSQTWCELCNVEWDGETPELYFTKLEFDYLSTMINKDRPIFLIQPFGGAPTQKHKYSWARDIPPIIAKEVADDMKKDYRVIQVRREDQLAIEGVEYLSLNPRQIILSIILSDKRLFIDSFMQHAAAALSLPSTVLWIVNSPLCYGYKINKNIVSTFQSGDLRNSFYEKFDILGDPIQIASEPNLLFNSGEIIKSLREDEKL